MSNDIFVPNNRGEHPDSKQPIAFRRLLTELSDQYEKYSLAQRLAQYIDDRDNKNFPNEIEALYRQTIKKINGTIVKGPVTYTDGNIFTYDKTDKSICMEGLLWRELVLLGHWIEDSLILKWSQLINDFSKNTSEFPVSKALELLLIRPELERRVRPARLTYESQNDLTCVWSNKPLSKNTLAIDHAIPFSLRHDNSLWNLLPADRKVNLNKSDKLPAESLLRKQKDSLIYNWQKLYSRQKTLFTSETCRFLGIKALPKASWELDLYNHFFETIELTAARRGIARWNG